MGGWLPAILPAMPQLTNITFLKNENVFIKCIINTFFNFFFLKMPSKKDIFLGVNAYHLRLEERPGEQ